MATPTVQSRANWASGTSDVGSFTPTMPSGIVQGDLLVCIFSADEAPTVSAANWNKLGQASNSTVVTGAIFWRFAIGGDTITVTTSSNQQATATTLRISGAVGIVGTSANGSSTNSDPPNLNAYLAKDILWVATRSGDAQVVATVAPTSFSNLQSQAAAGANGASTNTAERAQNTTTQNPATFTSGNEQWVSWTLAIIPVDGTPNIALLGGVSASATNTSTTAITVPPLQNRRLTVVFSSNGSGAAAVAVSTMAYGGVSLTKKAEKSSTVPSNDNRIEIWELVAPAAGTANLVINSVGATNWDFLDYGYAVLYGVSQESTPDSVAVGEATSQNTAVTTTSIADNCLAFSIGYPQDNPSQSVTGATEFMGSFFPDAAYSGPVTPAGSISHTYNGLASGEDWTYGIITVRPIEATITDVRSVSSASAGSGTAASVSAPTGTTTGDAVIVYVHTNGQTTIVDNNGGTPFTEDLNDYKPNTSYGHTVSVFSRIIQGGDPSSYAFTLGASDRWSVIAVTIKNPDPAIYDVTPATSNAESDGNSYAAPSITTLTNGAIHIAMAALDDGSTIVTGTPADYFNAIAENDEPMGVAAKRILTAGATGTQTFNFSAVSARLGVSLAIKPYIATTSQVKKISSITQANSKKIMGIAILSVKKVAGVSNT